jgi:hypothetical protein
MMPSAETIRWSCVLILAASAVLAMTACGKRAVDEPAAGPAPGASSEAAKAVTPPVSAEPPAAPLAREVKQVTFEPDTSTLHVGQTMSLAVTTHYALPPEGGQIGVVVLDAEEKLVTNKLTPAAGGAGTVTQKVDFKVPATSRLKVNVALFAKGEVKSSIVASRDYRVVAK